MKKHNIMIQGTGSSVGKSYIVAALCRIFLEDGYSPAPFKSQNMSLNSFVTKDNKEMGRAQVLQAIASGIEPDAKMNPILLKPNSDMGSQIILDGEVFGNYSASEYYKIKNKFIDTINKSYNSLSKSYNPIVIEGAGSPAEINLRDSDIVNMGLAHMIDAPVILIADIDRGGVFASIYGTYMLLSKKDRSRFKGFIINKFRGNKDLLMPGIETIEKLIKVPCLGIINYKEFAIDDEDSMDIRNIKKTNTDLKIYVIRLPFMSNFSDFTYLSNDERISLEYIDNLNQIDNENCDLIIIPGSKSTIKDMQYLNSTGIDKKIIELNNSGTAIFGICGGYQILGKRITDPHSIESSIKEIDGLGIIDMDTVINKEKTTVQVESKSTSEINGIREIKLKGYEIHMGESFHNKSYNPFYDNTGVVINNGRLIASYLHGVFDSSDFREEYIKFLYLNSKKVYRPSINNINQIDEIKKLASHIRKSINLKEIYRIIKCSL